MFLAMKVAVLLVCSAVVAAAMKRTISVGQSNGKGFRIFSFDGVWNQRNVR